MRFLFAILLCASAAAPGAAASVRDEHRWQEVESELSPGIAAHEAMAAVETGSSLDGSAGLKGISVP